jgi:phosphoribosylformylglycinamidine synthase
VEHEALLNAYENKLESVYSCNIPAPKGNMETFSYEGSRLVASMVKCAKPKVLIPAFPGTNCEYDSARAVLEAGGDAEIFVIRNLTADDVAYSAFTIIPVIVIAVVIIALVTRSKKGASTENNNKWE